MKFQWIVLALALTAGTVTRIIVDSNNNSAATPTVAANVLENGLQTVDIYNTDDSRLRVIYFGYTHCPDVCPTSLAVLSAALKTIEHEQLARLWPIFITLDPDRDTPEKSAQYAHFFHKNIDGMTGTTKQTKALTQRYGVLYQRTELENSSLEYAVDHSSYFYFLKPDGTLVEKVQHTLNPAILVETIERILDEPTS
ncbi:Cytochrome oxidase biogenesis protein Sco1/SenC/PrrC [Photobacterium marinum]|uniref:Cytochrome oxidase biogenesis protein Sco1/SenC/PrrC n=1 Tax=Photobacterium marinum TaxID=1056511 RepID=L8JBD9_9GAMM|nr:SCO family protein [Photobacterium marinum]ELR65578.1 Cytochrome oxidase biogenesis protein Sco1/SenC/PrrC [Photobacterium marinum]